MKSPLKATAPINGTYGQKMEWLDNLLIGQSPAMIAVKKSIIKSAPYDVHTIVNGETGTGKELIVQTLHALNHRENLLPINAAEISEALAVSLITGHKRGSFTGAVTEQRGFVQEANRGSLFVDEIDKMAYPAQGMFLRIVEEGKLRPLGATGVHLEIDVDVRIIAATNRDLIEQSKKGEFLDDLYHRLSEVEIFLPPLRERFQDLPMLVDFLLNQLFQKGKLRTQHELDAEALKKLTAYHWPGNVRELKKFLRRCGIDAEFDNLRTINARIVETNLDAMNRRLGQVNTNVRAQVKADETKRIEISPRRLKVEISLEEAHRRRDEFNKYYEMAGYNFAETARMMGYSRTALYNRINRAQEVIDRLDQDPDPDDSGAPPNRRSK